MIKILYLPLVNIISLLGTVKSLSTCLKTTIFYFSRLFLSTICLLYWSKYQNNQVDSFKTISCLHGIYTSIDLYLNCHTKGGNYMQSVFKNDLQYSKLKIDVLANINNFKQSTINCLNSCSSIDLWIVFFFMFSRL